MDSREQGHSEQEPLLGSSGEEQVKARAWTKPFRWFWSSGTAVSLMMAFLFSCAVGITKHIQGVYFTVPYFVCILSLAEFATGTVIAVLTGSFPLLGTRKNIPWLILVGLIYGGFVTLIYVPLAFIPAVDDIALLYSNPILATIIGSIVFRDKFGVFSALGLILYAMGIISLSKPEFIFGTSDIVWTEKRKVGYFLGAASGLLAAIALNLLRGLKDKIPAATLPLWAYMAQFIYCFPFLFFIPPTPDGEPIGWVNILPILAGGIFAGTAEYFVCRACFLLPAGYVGVIGSTQLIWVAFWGWLIAHEPVGWFTVLGCVLMMLGVGAVGYNQTRKPKGETIPSEDVSGTDEKWPVAHAEPFQSGTDP